MSGDFSVHAAWILAAAYAISLGYEIYRATARAGTSRYDSIGNLVHTLPLYVVAAAVVGALLLELSWAPIVALVFAVVMIVVSVVYYNPVMLPARRPGLVDWFEDLTYTGLLFVAATLLLYDVLGVGATASPL